MSLYTSITVGSVERGHLSSGGHGHADHLLKAKDKREGSDPFLHASTAAPGFNDRSFNAAPGAAPSPDGCDIRPGSTILGAGLALRPRYVTRICLDRAQQRDQMCHEGLLQAGAPCCSPLTYRHAWNFIWLVVSSTPFLVACHVLALLLGVIKLANAYHATAFKFSGFLTTLETLLVIAVVIIRVIQANRTYNALRGDLKYLQLMPRAETKTILGVRDYAYSFTGISIGILVCDLIILLILGSLRDDYAHVGWSVMSNQIVLVVLTGLSIAFLGLMDHYRSALYKDINQVVLFEALFLLRETLTCTRAQTAHHHGVTSCHAHEVRDRVDCFLRALHGTDIFKGPEYMSSPGYFDGAEDLLNALTTLDQINGASNSPRPRSHSEVQL